MTRLDDRVEILLEVADRSRRVIEHEKIRKLNLTVGPMAISGSTRMQASTILMSAVGLALTHYKETSNNTPLPPSRGDLRSPLEGLTRIGIWLRSSRYSPPGRGEGWVNMPQMMRFSK